MIQDLKKSAVGLSLFFLSLSTLAGAQNPAPAGSSQTTAQQTAPVPDSSRAYYHFMLARRFRELAGIWNRNDLVDRAIAEYKQAMEADPDSLFLRIELAELYWRVRRVGDAIREAEAVLKINPDYEDAHRLLARVYWHNLGDQQPDRIAQESLRKATEHLEAVTRINPGDAESWVALGRLYKLSNQNAKAAEAFRKVLTADPNSKNALSNLVQLYFDQGDYEQAIELIKKVPEDEMEPPLLGMLGYAYTQAHDYEGAISAYQKALALDPENQEVRRAYADALVGDGKLAEARGEFEKILKADPEDGFTNLRLAQLDRQEGRFDQARQELDRAKNLMPDNPEVPYQQALLEDLVGNQDKAIQLLQGLIKKFEKSGGQYTMAEANNLAIFRERLGLIYRSQEKFDEALAEFREIAALGKNFAPRAEAVIIETLRLNRQRQKALQEAEAAIQQYPEERGLRVLQATLLAEQGRADEAIQQLQTLLKGTPGDREVHLALAQIYSQARRFAEAEAAVLKALELTPKPEDQEYALFMLGSIFERQKKYDLAEDNFKKVLKSNPLNAAAANYLGYMLADRGVRLEESVRYIKKALELEPSNGAYLDSLGWAYFRMNRLDLAEPHLEKAARLISNDPTIHEHLGQLYFKMGKKQQAKQEWERALQEWPHAVTSDFDAEQAARLQKQLEDLKLHLAKDKSSGNRN